MTFKNDRTKFVRPLRIPPDPLHLSTVINREWVPDCPEIPKQMMSAQGLGGSVVSRNLATSGKDRQLLSVAVSRCQPLSSSDQATP